MKGSVIFASLIVTGESLTCTGSDDPSASVPFCYSGADLGETVDVKVEMRRGQSISLEVVWKVSLVWGSLSPRVDRIFQWT